MKNCNRAIDIYDVISKVYFYPNLKSRCLFCFSGNYQVKIEISCMGNSCMIAILLIYNFTIISYHWCLLVFDFSFEVMLMIASLLWEVSSKTQGEIMVASELSAPPLRMNEWNCFIFLGTALQLSEPNKYIWPRTEPKFKLKSVNAIKLRRLN